MILTPTSVRFMMSNVFAPLSVLHAYNVGRAKKEKLTEIYTDLLQADEYILRDIGVTRQDLLRMREDLYR